jgi:hypothetical protein
MTKKPELLFSPGCFDEFEGTQEELNNMLLEIHAMVNNGTFMDGAEELTEEEVNAYMAKSGNTLQ